MDKMVNSNSIIAKMERSAVELYLINFFMA